MLDFLTPIEFRRRYGLSVPAFEYVLGLIRDDITDAADGHGGARNSAPMPPEMKLAATLRWLRGGSPHDIEDALGPSFGAFYEYKDQVIDAICAAPELDFAARSPSTAPCGSSRGSRPSPSPHPG